MNEKGFTLIELLATITILSMIMLVAVPNVMSTLDKSKRRTYVEDAKKMISLAEYRIRSDTSITMPDVSNDVRTAVAITLKSMDLTDFSDGPEGGSYDLDRSFVVITKTNNSYTYYATLVEKYGDNTNPKYRGIKLVESSALNAEDAITKVKDFTTSELPNIPTVNSPQMISGFIFYFSEVINQK